MRERMSSSEFSICCAVYVRNWAIFCVSSYCFSNNRYLQGEGRSCCTQAGCSLIPVRDVLVWQHLGGVAQLRSELCVQAVLLPWFSVLRIMGWHQFDSNLKRIIFIEQVIMLSRLCLWTSSPFLLMHLKPPFLGKHVNFARFMEFLFQDPFCISWKSL